MTNLRLLTQRARGSRAGVAGSVAVCALLLSVAVPSLLAALGSLSGPVGCHSSVDYSDDFTDDFSGDVSGDVGEGIDISDDVSDDFSDDFSDDPVVPCAYDTDGGGEDSGGGVAPAAVDAGAVEGTPTFTG